MGGGIKQKMRYGSWDEAGDEIQEEGRDRK